jgi:hypothetical protein
MTGVDENPGSVPAITARLLTQIEFKRKKGGSTMKRPVPDRQRKSAQKPSEAIATEARAVGLLPLEYMLSVMRDPSASKERRDRMAVTAARYLCPKAGDKGKKGLAAEAAKEAGVGSEWDTDLQYSGGRPRE